jgi:hypothetical protein
MQTPSLICLLPKNLTESPTNLMRAIEKVFEAHPLLIIFEDLKSSDEPGELAQKIDVALSLLSAHPVSQELSGILRVIYTQIKDCITQNNLVDPRYLNEADTLAKNGNYAGALKKLKEIFDNGPLFSTVASSDLSEKQIAAAQERTTTFKNSSKLTPEQQSTLIQLEQRKFAHNLSMFATFQLIAGKTTWSPKEANEKFSEILQAVEKIPYDGSANQEGNKTERENVFNDKLGKLSGVNSVTRYIIFKIVQYFTNQVTLSIVQWAQTAFVTPLQNHAQEHCGIMHTIHNVIDALLSAEHIWRNDKGGNFGHAEKDDKLCTILQFNNPQQIKPQTINGDDLVKRCVDKVLDQFDIGTFSRITIINSIAHFIFKKMVRLIIHQIGFIERSEASDRLDIEIFSPIKSINSIAQFTFKKIAELVAHQMGFTGEYIDKTSQSTSGKKFFQHRIDALLLKQIQKLDTSFEKKGDEGEEGKITPPVGNTEKRIATQIIDKFFYLLYKHPVTDPEKPEQSPNGMINNRLKPSLVHLLLSGMKQLQTPETMNQMILTALTEANLLLRPSTETLLTELFRDHDKVKNPEKLSEEQLINHFETYYSHCKSSEGGVITVEECEKALAIKHAETRTKLDAAMNTMITKVVKHVLDTRIETETKPSRKILLEEVQWMYEQFIPYKGASANKKTYIEEMEMLLSECNNTHTPQTKKEALLQQIKTRHEQFLIQFQNRLTRMKALRKDAEPKINRYINHFYQAMNHLETPLETLNEALISQNTSISLKAVQNLGSKMRLIKKPLEVIERALSDQKLSWGAWGKEKVSSGIKTGGQLTAKPVNEWCLSPHFKMLSESFILLYKKRSTFIAITQEGILRPISTYTIPKNTNPNAIVAATNDFIINQFEIIDASQPDSRAQKPQNSFAAVPA